MAPTVVECIPALAESMRIMREQTQAVCEVVPATLLISLGRYQIGSGGLKLGFGAREIAPARVESPFPHSPTVILACVFFAPFEERTRACTSGALLHPHLNNT